MDEVLRAQTEIGRALRRAHAGEDRALAARVREEGDRLAHLFAGVLAMARTHALDNRAFDQPLRDLGAALVHLAGLLGSVHLLTVEEQVYVNDVRIRLEGTEVGSALGARLARHGCGGLSFHAPLSDSQWRALVAAVAAEPAATAARSVLGRALLTAGLTSVEVVSIHHFRVGQPGEAPVASRPPATVVQDGVRLAEESWANLAAERMPNPLPLRRLVAELMLLDANDPAYWFDGAASAAYGAHLVRVVRLALLIGRAAGLSTSALQDLGVAAFFHDVGYAFVEPGTATGSAAPRTTLARHPVTGVRLLLRQRGFHEAKLRRVRATLGHHRRCDDARGGALFARILAIAEDYDTLTQERGGSLAPEQALARMAAAGGTVYDPTLLQLFVNAMGRYPLGTLLDLSDGRVGRVIAPVRAAATFAQPLVRVERLADRAAYVPESIVDLALADAPAIASVVDPAEVASWPAMSPAPEPPSEPPPEPPPAPPPAEEPAASLPTPEAAPVARGLAADAGCSARPLYQGVLADVLRDLYLNRRTGVLYLTRGAERRSVRIWKGNVIHATSNLREDHLGEVAVREGLMSQADFDRANELIARERKRLGQVLRELEIMGEDGLEQALAVHAREVIVKTFAWTDGFADFEEQEAAPSWFTELALRLSTPDLILEAVRRIDDPDVVRYHLGDVDRPLRLSVDPLMKSLAVSLKPLDGFVLSRIDGHLTAREVIRIVPGDPVDVQRSLFSLVCVGIVEYVPSVAAAGLSGGFTPVL
jgi:hypothetical protein